MKKTLIVMVIGISIFNLVSCVNKNVDQNTISNKYPIDEYLKKGATLENYEVTGTAIMKDTNGERFFAGYNSTYKVELSEEGIILPYIIIEGIAYYFEDKIEDKNIPDELKKLGGVSTFSSNIERFFKENDSNINYVQNLTAYSDEKDSSLIYTTSKGMEGYQVWSNYKK
ncbi:Uncharacterised protein [uncultured Clostridium sp.]|uniref:hypothetical protein n=1 Tax=uncultured Clostridium sp. TaxID=59620 RepID=UPI000820C2E3|nr:hypothetical protein [uncultured Clostridium sp.]SCJ52766.1 Uncharacterised protein [uncultured Clostridium sp.]